MERARKRKPAFCVSPHATKRFRGDGGKEDLGNSSEDDRFSNLLGKSLPSYYSSFTQSRKPARFMFYKGAEWKEFSPELSAALCAPFMASTSSREFCRNGSRYLISFVRMVQVNLVTGFCRSIAWFDVEGKLFTPSKCIEGYSLHMIQSGMPCSWNLQDAIVPGKPCSRNLRKVLQDACNSENTSSEGLAKKCPASHIVGGHLSSDYSVDKCSTDTSSDSISDVTSLSPDHVSGYTRVHHSHDFTLLHHRLEKLNEGDREFDDVRDRFIAGLSILANFTTVTGINRNCHKSTAGSTQQQAFKQQEEITKTICGDANIRYAWYATSKKGVSSVILHGFGQPKDGGMYGVGVYLSPECYSNLSAVYADVDENGEKHIVLCRVIMGRTEQVCRGSDQFHPSSEEYDAGVDNFCNPKLYIVWSTHMNTHILPEYIVSFKLASPWHDIIAALKTKGKNFVCSVPGSGSLTLMETNSAQIVRDGSKGAVQGCVNGSPKSPWMSIELLFLLMKFQLSGANMDALQQHYIDLKDKKLSSSDFNNLVRSIAGDRLVNDSIRSMQTHVLGAGLLQNLLASPRSRVTNTSRRSVA